ncbi:beta-1,3-galactosyltransferase 2-like [Bufo gargarizans]|uniref:beta-1,3-galactosyltransferase 2-like n=1 Tax=Bufo gargarizans TaxID=30331 RepID=UPI001CF4E6FE|nr:beta-1,3-galactosyltransferase 2-like [Bufo gargarizans]XP_044157673.1 beta-1,3-galactosyltransferase 2-like [Bufo gargarizans]XP_044157674.1 beta-1,3-galactosyltransferase 2-like [Bufo gargarizans]
MPLLKKLICTKLTVKLLLFFMFLMMLALLILTNAIWFPLGFVNPISNLQNLILNVSGAVKANDLPVEKSHTESGSSVFTEITMTKIADDIHKPHQYEYFINEPDKCKENVPFLVLLVTVQRWQREARQAIRNTWGKEDLLPGVKILRLFFLGKDPKPNTDADQEIVKESQEFHDLIQQDYLDTYNNLTIKVLMGLSWITTYCPNALYVMKTDSDMFVNTEYLVYKVLKPDQAPRKNYFTGYLMINGSPIRNLDSKWYVSPDVYPEKRYPPFCSGTGYVLSGDLSHKIVKIFPSVRWLHLEDVFIGLCLDKLGVQLVAPPKGSDFNNWRVVYSDCKYHNIVTSHGVSPGEMLNYWGRLQKSKHLCI